jgi:4-amino-4-deoxy-L-arabinose transferase-like glycosyltransferase
VRSTGAWLPMSLLAVALGLALALNLWRLGAISLVGDEAIYAYPARAAAVHGHWYPLTYGGGTVFYGKPPLMVWPVALSFWLNGVDEWADRLPSALAGAALVGLVYGFAAWLLGPWTGLLAAALLASCRPWLFVHGVREGVGEPLLCLLLMASLLLYLRYRSTGRGGWLGGACAAAALATLVKGPVAFCFLGIITLAWELARTRMEPDAAGAAAAAASAAGGTGDARVAEVHRRTWRGWASRLAAPAALSLAGGAVYCAWLLDYRRRGAFEVDDYLYRDVVRRAIAGLDRGHVHGAGFYAGVLADAFGHWWPAIVPAALCLWRGVRAGGPRARALLLVAVWPLAVLALLHASVSKLAWYLDPALPPLAILLAAGCGEVARRLVRWPAGPPVFAAVLAGLVAVRAATAWQILRGPAHRGQMQRFVQAFRRHPGARLYVQAGAGSGAQGMREWNYFYLSELDDVAQALPPLAPTARLARLAPTARSSPSLQPLQPSPASPASPRSPAWPPRSPAAAGGCTFALAERPAEVAARLHAAAWWAVPIERRSGEESPFYILDLCGGQVARGLS